MGKEESYVMFLLGLILVLTQYRLILKKKNKGFELILIQCLADYFVNIFFKKLVVIE